MKSIFIQHLNASNSSNSHMRNDNITPVEQDCGWNSNNRKAYILNNKRFENGEKIPIDFDKQGSRHKYSIVWH